MNFEYVIFEISNNQILAKKNEIIFSKKINYNLNNNILIFKNILLINTKDNILLGKPYLKNKFVIVKVIKNFKDTKINIIKFKRRKHHLKKINYRDNLTKIKILDIN